MMQATEVMLDGWAGPVWVEGDTPARSWPGVVICAAPGFASASFRLE